MSKIKFHVLVVFVLLLFPMHLRAQGWINIGSTLNQKTSQYSGSFVTKFNPDIEMGIRLPFFIFSGDTSLSDYSEWDNCFGIGTSFNLRFLNIEDIDWVKNDDYKFVWDFYVGPSFYFPFSDESLTGLLINPFIGYSTSGSWFDPDITSGGFSVKLSAELVIHKFSIGAAWRPLKLHIEGISAKTEYLTFRSFDYSPSLEIRIGYYGIF